MNTTVPETPTIITTENWSELSESTKLGLSDHPVPSDKKRFFPNYQTPPNSVLNGYYQAELGSCNPISSLMRTSSTFLNGRLWWTASFECPVSHISTQDNHVIVHYNRPQLHHLRKFFFIFQ